MNAIKSFQVQRTPLTKGYTRDPNASYLKSEARRKENDKYNAIQNLGKGGNKFDNSDKLNNLNSMLSKENETISNPNATEREKQLANINKKEIEARISELKANEPKDRYRSFARQLQNVDPSLSMKYDSMADSFNVSDGNTGSSVSELQQLWKDNKRFMTQLANRSGTNSSEYKQAQSLQNNIENQLKEIAPDVWKREDNQQQDQEVDKVDDATRFEELDAFEDGILSQITDNDNDGIIDVPLKELRKTVNRFIRDKGFSDEDKKRLLNAIESANNDIKSIYGTNQSKIDKSIDRRSKRSSQARSDLNNYIERSIGSGADNIANKLREKVQGIQLAIGADNTYIGMKKALGDAIGGGDYGGLANFRGFEGIQSKLNDFIGNNAMTEEKSKEVLQSFVGGFNAMIDGYNKSINSKLGDSEFRDSALNRLEVDQVELKTPKNKSSNEKKELPKIRIEGFK